MEPSSIKQCTRPALVKEMEQKRRDQNHAQSEKALA